MQDIININLKREEAIVLFEWLASRDEGTQDSGIGDAEQKVLWMVEGQLEKSLVEVFAKNLFGAARKSKDQNHWLIIS